MVSSLVLTMLVIPAVYLLWEWRRLRKRAASER
jgi:Cu/Ag efflux pump CusA